MRDKKKKTKTLLFKNFILLLRVTRDFWNGNPGQCDEFLRGTEITLSAAGSGASIIKIIFKAFDNLFQKKKFFIITGENMHSVSSLSIYYNLASSSLLILMRKFLMMNGALSSHPSRPPKYKLAVFIIRYLTTNSWNV